MLEGGYIKLHRRIRKWGWYRNTNTARVFIHLLLSANFAPHEFEGVTIERGQCACSQKNLAQDLGLSIRNVRTALSNLKMTGEVTVEKKPKFSVITVNRYDFYQQSTEELTDDRQHSDSRATERRQQSDNNIRKIKKEKNTRMRRNVSPQCSYDIEELEEINTLDDWEAPA